MHIYLYLCTLRNRLPLPIKFRGVYDRADVLFLMFNKMKYHSVPKQLESYECDPTNVNVSGCLTLGFLFDGSGWFSMFCTARCLQINYVLLVYISCDVISIYS